MNDQLKAAFASATETVKHTLTLASAILTVSVTFLKDVNKAPTSFQVWILEISWVSLLLAVLFGIATLAALTGTLARAERFDADILYQANIRAPMTLTFMCFLAGLTFTAWYGMASV